MNASPRASFWVGCACVSNANPSGWRPLLKTSPLLAVSHRGDLWFAVGHARDGCLVDGFGAPTGNLLSDEDPLLEPLVRQLQPGNNVPDRVNVRHIGAQALIRDDEAAVHGDPLLLVAEPACGRPPPDRDQEYIGLERVAPRNRHATPSSVRSTPSKGVPRRNPTLRLRKAFSNARDASTSSLGSR